MKTFVSSISKKEFPGNEEVFGKSVRKSIYNLIVRDCPDFGPESSLALSELNMYRQHYLSEYLKKELGDLTQLEEDVLKTLNEHELISENALNDTGADISFGQRLADRVAAFGGSWKFIILFSAVIFFWIGTNVVFLANKGFDPYPFILLNLILSCLAALQAPVIMMSQNRQEEKDRERARQDYRVNLKAEIEIRTLHEKLDHLIIHQQQELLNIQQIQIEMLEDIMDQIKKRA